MSTLRWWWLGALGMLLGTGCDEDWERELGLELYFVRLSDDATDVVQRVEAISEDFGIEPEHVFQRATKGFSVPLTPELVEELEAVEDIDYIQIDPPEQRIPDDDPEDRYDDLEPILGDDEVPESIARIGGPFLSDVDGCHVAVVDTGIDADHPELNVVGEIDVVAESGGTPAPGADPQGHGTHVAGTVAARVDGNGVAGVAPGFPLHNVRVLNEHGAGTVSDIILGLEYVLEHPDICVANLSLGGPADLSSPQPLRDAMETLEAEDVLVVSAAGNASRDTNGYAPSGYGLGLVVSAYDAAGGTDNGLASFTNFGDAVHVTAPGVDVLSTWPGGEYTRLSGTSMAAPAVAGAAAVYMTLNPGAGPLDVRDAMLATGEHGFPGQTDASGQHPEPMVDTAALFHH